MAESGILLRCQGSNPLEGSNPSASAKFQNGFLERKLGRAEGATLMHSPRRIQNPKGFSTLRVGRRLPIQFYE